MRYGCIGEHLAHSFSKEIHGLIANYDYELRELKKYEVEQFLKKGDFLAINVTIPYKETVIPYLSHIDEGANLIGAVNTIVNKNGKLYGYNTDFFGMSALARHAKIDFQGKKVLILGTGGTSKTAYAVASYYGAKEVLKASRTPKKDAVSYIDVYKFHTDSEIIINTTPVGMYPDIFEKPIDLSKFYKLSGVIDAIYNPINTPLILDAKERGIAAEGGLYMLAAQGVKASQIFLDTTYNDSLLDDVFSKIVRQKQNIVLIGMPTSGKTTVGKILAKKLNRILIDTDSVIFENTGKKATEIFAGNGESEFRRFETEAVKLASKYNSAVIACGGGVILNPDNVKALSENGKIYFLDRSIDKLIPTCDRPTAFSRQAIEKIFNERYSFYKKYSDYTIKADGTPDSVANEIIKEFIR